MNPIYILFAMTFCHLVDDYYLQGILAQMKQKKWWKENSDNFDKYKNDYKVALMEHAFSWTFVTMLPILIYSVANNIEIVTFYVIQFIVNWIIHAIVDDLKANKLTINLVVDQACHLIQIVLTWIAWLIIIR